MATLYTEATHNTRKTWFLMTAFLLVVIALGLAVSWYMDSPAIVYGVVIFAIAMNIASYWFSDTIVLKMAGARKADKEQDWELITTVENLAITAGLPMPKVYVINDPSPNAFATGRNPEHAAVAATTGLLSLLEKNELEGVMAHELAHVQNRDTLIGTVVVVLVGFVTILSDMFLRWSFWGGESDRGGDSRIRAIMTIVAIVLAILAPIFAKLLQLAISRKREFLADASGALLTRYPQGLASALRKIESTHIPLKRAQHATAHLYISNPFKDTKKDFLGKFFMTHPPTSERIAALLGGKK
jgi:heat shock protein HtpX